MKKTNVRIGGIPNRLGFTLVELLAVIVILAIIALIATPIVLNIIKDTKQSSILQSANFYLNAVEQSIARENDTTGTLKNTKCDIEDNGNVVCEGYEKQLKIEINGEKPDSGKIVIKENKIEEIELYYKDKLIIKDEEKNLTYSKIIYEDVKDSNPGIICGEGTKEDLTEETCYIKSIEDLVGFSKLVNNRNTFVDKIVELKYNLDFNSKRSYASKKVDETLITGSGFSTIGGTFKGIFEGNYNTIRGLYGRNLFGYLVSGVVQNLTICDANVNNKRAILIEHNDGGTIQNINLYNVSFTNDGGREIGTLVGVNKSGIIKNINAININVKGTYLNTAGLVGSNDSGIIENVTLENINMENENRGAAAMVAQNSGTIKNVKATNLEIFSSGGGGLIGSSSGIVENIELENVKVNSGKDYTAGLLGTNNGGIVKNISLKNINVIGGMSSGALVGQSSGIIKNIVGENMVIKATNRRTGGLVGTNSGNINQIRLTNIELNGTEWLGGLAGTHEAGSISYVDITKAIVNGTATKVGGIVGVNYALVENSIFSGNVKGRAEVGLGVGANSKGQIKNIVAKGNAEGSSYIGGLIGSSSGTSEEQLSNISGVYLSGNISSTGANVYRMIGSSKNTTLNTLASSQILVNGSPVVSDDPTSLNGKSLDDMGIAAKSEYEALGFEFESTDENEAYWYFNENDELDLFIK